MINMKKELFFEKLQDVLETDQKLDETTEFESLDNFDSMSVMVLIAFADENFSKKISAMQFKEMKTVSDLMAYIGADQFN